MKNKKIIIFIVLIIILILSGCGNKKKSLKGLKTHLKKSGFEGFYFNVPRILFKKDFEKYGIKGIMSYNDSEASFAIFVEISNMDNKDKIIDFIIRIKDQMQTSTGDEDAETDIKTEINGEEVALDVNYVEKDKFIMVYWLENNELVNSFKEY